MFHGQKEEYQRDESVGDDVSSSGTASFDRARPDLPDFASWMGPEWTLRCNDVK